MVKKVSAKRPNEAGLNVEEFRYADELGLELPQLILAIEVSPRSEYARSYQFKIGRDWIRLAHQTAGPARHQRYLYASRLTPKSVDIVQGMNSLSRKWGHSHAGCGGVSLDRAVEYQNDLKKLFKAGCNVSHHGFEEGFYPIDIEYLPDLAADKMPDKLEDLVQWSSAFERAAGCVNRFKLVILGSNSD